MTKVIKADLIFDGEKFLSHNSIVIKDKRIVGTIYTDEQNEKEFENIEIHQGIITPGFINAHCHLELSYLQGQFTPACGMLGFLRQMASKRFLFDKKFIFEKIIEWDKKMQENGIVATGDIVNSTDTIAIKKNSGIRYLNFVEIFGLNKNHADKIFENALHTYKRFIDKNLQTTIVPHSPYSLSDKLWNNYFHLFKHTPNDISSFHFMESESEKALVSSFSSDMKDYFIDDLHYDEDDIKHIYEKFETYLQQYFNTSKKIILVHNTFLDENIVFILEKYREKIVFCLCPNANLYIENTLPDVELLKNFSNQICLGTDSLASNNNLSIVDEMNVLLKNFKVSTEEVLKWATSNGAKALDISNQYGYIRENYHIPLNLIKIENDLIKHIAIII